MVTYKLSKYNLQTRNIICTIKIHINFYINNDEIVKGDLQNQSL